MLDQIKFGGFRALTKFRWLNDVFLYPRVIILNGLPLGPCKTIHLTMKFKVPSVF